MAFSARFEEALVAAAQWHSRQTRKGCDTPYIAHLLTVAATVIEHGATEDEAIAALLHDAVEDQGGDARADEIRARFGDRAAEIVLECSDTTVQPKPPWHERKRAFAARIPAMSASARLILAADKLHNARSILSDLKTIGPQIWNRFNAPRADSIANYRTVLNALRASASADPRIAHLLDDLDEAVDQLERTAN